MSLMVLVTRPFPLGSTDTADPLAEALVAYGLGCRHVPTVEIAPADLDPLVRALAGDSAPDWLVVTSANGAGPVALALKRAGGLPRGTRVAAVGPGTAAALRTAGIQVDHQPSRFLTTAIADGLGPMAGRRIVLARADAASPQLATRLTEAGALVEDVVAYRTIEGPPASRAPLREAVAAGPDLVTFTSGSTVRGLVTLLAGEPEILERARRTPSACIGPVTAAEASRLGFSTPVVATRHTLPALATAIAAYARQEPAA